MKRRYLTSVMLVLISGVALGGVGDRVAFQGAGPRVGVTMDPGQVHLGLHADLGLFAEDFRLRPNVEVGVGDHRTLAAFNMETAYQFASTWGLWSPYVGGGVGLNVNGRDREVVGEPDSGLGASFLGGIEKGLSSGDRVFLEAKLGLVDSPSMKFAVGWTFY